MTDPISAPAAETSYPIGSRNRVKRLHERAKYDRASVWSVLDSAMLCHVAYVIDGQPYCTPTIHWRDGDRLYWHGSSASRMLRVLAHGVPVCLTVSHLDGLVLARTGFNHSANYRSALCFGTAALVTDGEEKAAALEALIDRYYPDRAAMLRPISAQEMKATSVIAMTIEEAAMKTRAKGVADDEEDLGHPVWAAVIPVTQVIGAAEPCPRGTTDTPRAAGLDAYRPGRRLDEAFLETQKLWEGEK